MTHAGIDTTRPNVARTYDYLLGGIESYTADREQAADLLRICPSLGIVALENRFLLARAVAWAAGQGVTQFIDLGAGMPVQKARPGVLEDIHVTAQTASPSARVAYVDNDPLVSARSRLFRAPARGVAICAADLTDRDSVLADLDLRAVIDLAQPACFIFGLALSLVPAADARDVVASYLDQAAPGSYVVISCGRCDDEALWAQLDKAYTAAEVHNHAPAEIEGFLDGLEPVPPGVVPAQSWRGGSHGAPAAPPGPVYVLAGVARKPVLQPVLALEDDVEHQCGQDHGGDGGDESGFLAEARVGHVHPEIAGDERGDGDDRGPAGYAGWSRLSPGCWSPGRAASALVLRVVLAL